MNAVQAKVTLLDQYNQITLQEAKFTGTADVLQQKFADSNMQTDELQLTHTFMNQVSIDTRRLALESFHITLRTFNCISLTYPNMLEPLGALQCFDNLTEDHLNVAFKGYFIESDGAKLKALSNYHLRVTTNADDPLPHCSLMLARCSLLLSLCSSVLPHCSPMLPLNFILPPRSSLLLYLTMAGLNNKFHLAHIRFKPKRSRL